MEEPLSAAALVGWAWRLYMANWRPVLAVSSILAVLEWLFYLGTVGPNPTAAQVAASSPTAFDFGGPLLLAAGTWGAATLLNFFGGAAEENAPGGGGIWACARSSLPRTWPVFVTVLTATLAGILGCALLVVPGIYILTRWSVAPVVAAAEGKRVTAALCRSSALTAGHFWHVLGTVLLALVLIAAAIFSVGDLGGVILTAAGLRNPVGLLLWGQLVASAANPWLLATLVVLRDDLELRAAAS